MEESGESYVKTNKTSFSFSWTFCVRQKNLSPIKHTHTHTHTHTERVTEVHTHTHTNTRARARIHTLDIAMSVCSVGRKYDPPPPPPRPPHNNKTKTHAVMSIITINGSITTINK